MKYEKEKAKIKDDRTEKGKRRRGIKRAEMEKLG